jgi:hypothetical protein
MFASCRERIQYAVRFTGNNCGPDTTYRTLTAKRVICSSVHTFGRRCERGGLIQPIKVFRTG